MTAKNSYQKTYTPVCPHCGKKKHDSGLGLNSFGTYVCEACKTKWFVKTDQKGNMKSSGQL